MRKFMLFVMMVLAVAARSQTTPVTGQVKDEKGDAVPFATIRVKGRQVAVSADQAGNFSIQAARGSTLVVSGAGFDQTEIPVGSESTVLVSLKSQSTLNEVVVTALGIQRQAKDLGYATTRIRNAELTQGRSVNLQNGLTGKVSGLNITTVNSGVLEETKIVLRGIRSLTGNNQPMLLVDAIPTPLSFISTINPNDVQDVTILKGASGAALYGPDGANGVILVTTRRGTTNGSPTISVSHTAQLARVSFLPKLQTRYGSGSIPADFGEPGYIPYENQQYGPQYNGQMVQLGRPLEDGSVQMVPYSYLKNEKKKFWNNGVTLQTDVSYNNKDFYISAQDVEVKGLTPKDKNRRTSVRFNASKEYGKFKTTFNLNYIQGSYDVLNNAGYASRFASSYNGSVYFAVLNTPGHVPLTSYKDPGNKWGQYSNYYNEYFVSPYWIIDNHRSARRSDDILGSARLEYSVAPWLNMTYRLGSSLDFYSYKNTNSPITVSDFAAANRGQQYRNQPGSVADGSGSFSRITHEFFFNGRKDISDFRVSYILGTRYRQNRAKAIDIAGNNLVVPGLYNISNRSGEAAASEFNSSDRLFSLFGQVGLNYKNWANIEVSAANDWDSRLYLNADSKISFFYPTVDASVSLIDAIPSLKGSLLSYAKIRGSISKSANVNIGTYALEATYSQTGGFAYGNLGGFSAGNIKPDVGLKPEIVNSKEVGVELGFLKNRLNVDVTYFYQKNTDQILSVQQSYATGYPSRLANTADFNNYGVEMDVNLSPVVNIGSGRLNFKAQATYNNNKVTSLFPGINELNIGGVEGFTQRAASSPQANNYAIVGQPAFVFKLSDYARDPQGHVVVDRVTGNPKLSDSLVVRGRTLPLWILGFSPSFTFKGLSIGMTWEYRGGNYLYSGLGSDMDFSGISERSAQFDRKRFVFPNSVYYDGAKYVQNDNIQVSTGGVNFWTSGALNSSVATNYFASAAFWKLRELSIGYDLPAKLLGGNKVIKRATFNLVGRNLLTFLPSSNQWTDPEFNYTSTGNTFGISNVFSTPPSRLYGATVTLTF